MRILIITIFLFLLSSTKIYSNRLQVKYLKTTSDTSKRVAEKSREEKSEWYRKINLRGYTQLRYNRLLETNPDLQCEQCDRSWGGTSGFYLRRVRLVLFGQITDRINFYIQPDFASSVDASSNNFLQLRDAYFDLGLDKKNEFRLRFGQTKIPYGFENMQSSQNRLTLDRSDAINSAISNERDLGVFFYWAPEKIRELLSDIGNAGLKGSGDYGVFGIGFYNGQGLNRNEANNQPHVVARLAYPFQFRNNQIIETGIQFYTGKYILPSTSSGVTGNKEFEYKDQRVAASFILYPQPFGLQMEYNIGTGPEYNPLTNNIDQKQMNGGYALASYAVKVKNQLLLPFVRYQYYNGGKKHERDARSYTVNDIEVGTEWQPLKNLELVVTYTASQRRFEDSQKPLNDQKGRLLRLQLQFNY